MATYDCLGNRTDAQTPEGYCVLDIYQKVEPWYNTETDQTGHLEDGHFVPCDDCSGRQWNEEGPCCCYRK